MISNIVVPIQQSAQYTFENLVRGVDFTNYLSPTSDTLTGSPVVTVSVLSGTDPNPSDILIGSPVLSENSMQILQRVSGGVAGTIYLLSFRCGTVQGNTWEQQVFFSVIQG